jgi:hypothetical protein
MGYGLIENRNGLALSNRQQHRGASQGQGQPGRGDQGQPGPQAAPPPPPSWLTLACARPPSWLTLACARPLVVDHGQPPSAASR